MFCLDEIRSKSIVIKATRHKSATWPPAILSGYKAEVSLLTSLELRLADVHIPEDTRNLERNEINAFKLG